MSVGAPRCLRSDLCRDLRSLVLCHELCQSSVGAVIDVCDLPSCLTTFRPADNGGIDEEGKATIPIAQGHKDTLLEADGYWPIHRRAPACSRKIPDTSINHWTIGKASALTLNGSPYGLANRILFHQAPSWFMPFDSAHRLLNKPSRTELSWHAP